MKIKSFGLIEAMIASFIAITVLSGAVALASSVNKSTTIDSSYSEAEQIADNFLENLNFANSQGRIFFDARSLMVDGGTVDPIFSIDCFNSALTNACHQEYGPTLDNPKFLDFYWNNSRTIADTADPSSYQITKAELNNDSFPDGFFKIKTTIRSARDSLDTIDVCKTVAGVAIPVSKCRVVDVEVRWSENVGDQTYKVSKYITDWTR
jgi:hypothetical protein